MIFDKLCGLVERQLPEFRKYVEGARLFHFAGNPHEFLPNRFEEIEFLRENFYLPFRTVALEDNASVILIQDPEPFSTPPNRPLWSRRFSERISEAQIGQLPS